MLSKIIKADSLRYDAKLSSFPIYENTWNYWDHQFLVRHTRASALNHGAYLLQAIRSSHWMFIIGPSLVIVVTTRYERSSLRCNTTSQEQYTSWDMTQQSQMIVLNSTLIGFNSTTPMAFNQFTLAVQTRPRYASKPFSLLV